MRVPSAGGTERIPSFASTTKLGEPDRDWGRPPLSPPRSLSLPLPRPARMVFSRQTFDLPHYFSRTFRVLEETRVL